MTNLNSQRNQILGTGYNHLNMLASISVGSDFGIFLREMGNIQFIYGATGEKLDHHRICRELYLRKGSLKLFFRPGGYVEPDGNGGFDYVYNYKDQINNVRLSYSDTNGDGSIDPNTEILHERNYYPFGLLHRGYNNVINGTVNNKEQYQGQEYTEDLGVNIHEWKYRFSDPAIGRFWQIDPLATEYNYQSPYNFSENRVIDAFELEGLEKVSIHTRAFAPFNF